jgi:hypothetical protein
MGCNPAGGGKAFYKIALYRCIGDISTGGKISDLF